MNPLPWTEEPGGQHLAERGPWTAKITTDADEHGEAFRWRVYGPDGSASHGQVRTLEEAKTKAERAIGPASFVFTIDTRASLTIGPLTIFEDGEIKVREGTPPREIASLVLAAVEEAKGWARVEEHAKLDTAIAQIEREAAEAHDDAWSKGALRAVDVLRGEPAREPVSCKNTEHQWREITTEHPHFRCAKCGDER